MNRALLPSYGASISSIRAYLGGFDSIPNRDEVVNAFQSAGVGITTYSRQESVNIERSVSPPVTPNSHGYSFPFFLVFPLRLIVVDLFTFLMDHREQYKIPPTFVLVSANLTAYIYAISKLRERGIKFILIGNGKLEGRADVTLDWREVCGTAFGANGRGVNGLSRFVLYCFAAFSSCS